jgi:hypothetical protein
LRQQVEASLAHSGLEPEFTNVDVWQPCLPARRAKMLAALPIRSFGELLTQLVRTDEIDAGRLP